MLAHLGAAVAIGFLLASVVMNYLFGHSLGRTPLEAAVYGVVGALAVVANALCPFFAERAHKARRLATLYAVLAFWALCLLYSLTSALGFAADNQQALVAPKAALHDVLATKLDTLRDLEARKRSPQIETRIHALRDEINGLRLKGAAHEPDPQSAFLARVIGLDRSDTRLLLLVLFALMVEAGAAIGLYAALSTVPPQPRRSKAPAGDKPESRVKVWNPAHKAGATSR